MSSALLIGTKEWWIRYLKGRSHLEVRENTEYSEYLEITKKVFQKPLFENSISWIPKKPSTKETKLKNALRDSGLFERFLKEEKVKLGKAMKRLDILGYAQDVVWVVEGKIVESKKAKIDMQQIGQAIGQSVIYSYLYKIRYRQTFNQKVMPAVCSWMLGSGSSDIIETCRIMGITVIEFVDLSLPRFRIHYLYEENPRPFCDNWDKRP